MDKEIFIFSQIEQGVAGQETLELITFAFEISKKQIPTLILLGSHIEEMAIEILTKTGCNVIAVIDEDFKLYNNQTYTDAIMDILPKENPCWVCLSHTSFGYDLAPGIGVRLNAACITAVEKVNGSALSRSINAGRFVADITPDTPSVVVTVLPGAFEVFKSGTNKQGTYKVVRPSMTQSRSKTLCKKESACQSSSLKDAEVIVSAGRGIGKKDNLKLIEDVASLFSHCAIGASRSVCDLGWLSYSHQIGTTGQNVSPKLYFACGISGAIQHISGMKGSRNIVAVNIDPKAAIFNVAHYCIVEDLMKFLPVLIEEISNRGI